jgi:hypothetical protein
MAAFMPWYRRKFPLTGYLSERLTKRKVNQIKEVVVGIGFRCRRKVRWEVFTQRGESGGRSRGSGRGGCNRLLSYPIIATYLSMINNESA